MADLTVMGMRKAGQALAMRFVVVGTGRFGVWDAIASGSSGPAASPGPKKVMKKRGRCRTLSGRR